MPMRVKDGTWLDAVRRPPVGVLVLAGLLGFLGAGFIVSSAYLAIAEPRSALGFAVAGLGAGPLAIYVALHLIRLTHWAWLALMLALVLLLASSAWRLLTAPPPRIVPIAELVVELLAVFYLTRPSVRGSFTRR
jgi:hypothetical protein